LYQGLLNNFKNGHLTIIIKGKYIFHKNLAKYFNSKNFTMKTKTILITLIAMLALTTLVFQSCEKEEEQKPNLPDVSIVDISQETDWDYCVVGKSDYFYVKANNNNIPEAVLFHSKEANKDYSIFFDGSGQLDKVVVDNYIFIFRNFNGSKVDIGVIYPNSDIELLREVETNYNWDNIGLKDATSTQAWSDLIRVASRSVAGVPCALAVALTIGSGGIAAPIAAWECGNFLLGLTVDVMENDFDVHNGFTDFVDTYGDASSGFACSSGDPVACAFSAASMALSEIADHVAEIENRSEEVNSTTAALEHGYGDVQITLTWTNTADLDLHVFDPNNEEIFWNHTHSASNGVLDVDDIDGYGPENIYWPQGEAPNGEYKVYVHHYPWPDQPSNSNYSVLITAFGETKSFSGSISFDQTIHIVDFNQNGFKNNKVTNALSITKIKK
jgi:hypothetical protein